MVMITVRRKALQLVAKLADLMVLRLAVYWDNLAVLHLVVMKAAKLESTLDNK